MPRLPNHDPELPDSRCAAPRVINAELQPESGHNLALINQAFGASAPAGARPGVAGPGAAHPGAADPGAAGERIAGQVPGRPARDAPAVRAGPAGARPRPAVECAAYPRAPAGD